MKKRLLALTVILCMAVTVCLTGCGSSDPFSKYDLSEYVKLGEYKGLERPEISVSVSDEEIETQIRTDLEAAAVTEKKESGTVQEGDTANIDYVGKLDGKAFDGGTAEGHDLEIGSGSFIDGFEDGLIGKKIGGTYDLELTFPEDYGSADLAGKDVVFTVTVNYVSAKVIPEFTDEWVKENSDVKTTAEYRDVIKENLYQAKEEEAKSNIIAAMWQQVVDDSEMIQYPEKEVGKYIKDIEAQYEQMAETYSMTLDDLLAAYGIESEEVYDQQNRAAAEAYIKDQMVMFYIAQIEGLEYTDKEADELRQAISDSGYDDKSFEEYYGQDIESYIHSALTYNKVAEFIFDNSVVK